MEEFVQFWRRRLAVHAAFLFLLGLGLGVLFMFAQATIPPDPVAIGRWRIAHMQGLTHGFLLFGLAATFGYFRLNRLYLKLAGWAVVVGAWAAVSASIISASFGVEGRHWNPDGWNRVAFILFALGVIGVSAALVLIVLRAAWEALRVVLAPMTFHNWAGTVAARPRIVTEPGNPAAGPAPDELLKAVDEGLRRRMPIRACGARASWNRGAVTSGMLIDVTRLNRVLGFGASDPQTGDPGWVKVQAGMRIGDVSAWLAQQNPRHTLRTAPVIPWVQVGGAVANGCHGTGMSHPEFPDTIVALEIVQDLDTDGVSQLETYTRPPLGAPQPQIDQWNALLVNLGTMGVLYSVTFECVPMFRVRIQESLDDMVDVIRNQLPAIASHDYAEIFWFPYSEKCWIKVWDATNASLEGLPAYHWLEQWIRTKILSPLFSYLLALVPWLSPSVLPLFDLLIPKLNRVVELPDAMHYQHYFTKAVDLGYALPFDPADPELVRDAWFAVVDRISAARHNGIYPQNLVLHLRFTRGGHALLGPSTGHVSTAYIEILSHRSTPRYEEHFAAVERDWLRLGGRPHWGKLLFHPRLVRANYPAMNVAKFIAIQKLMDPDGVFLNDHVREVLRI